MINFKGPSMGISGRFKIDVLNSKGELVEDKCLPEQKNLVTESGLVQLLSDTTLGLNLVLGTGSTPPQREDIRLDNAVTASTSALNYTVQTDISDLTMLSDTSFEISKEYVFNLGQVVGNITELGLAFPYNNLSNYTLLTRALIKDALGDATSIEILEDEQIKITYILKLEIEESNKPYSIMVEKDGDLIEHTVTPMFKILRTNRMGIFTRLPAINTVNIVSSSGGSSVDGDSTEISSGTFSTDRKIYTRELKVFAGINRFNGTIRWVGVFDFIGIGSSRFSISNGTPYGENSTSFIWQIDPPVTKTNEQVIEITCSVSATSGD